MTISKEAIEAGLRITLSSVNMPAGECLHETDVREILEAALPFLPIAVEGKEDGYICTAPAGEWSSGPIVTTPEHVDVWTNNRGYTARPFRYLDTPFSPGKDGGQEVGAAPNLPPYDQSAFPHGFHELWSERKMRQFARDTANFWRNDAIEKAAQIAERYSADPWISRDIRALRGLQPSPQPASTALVERLTKERDALLAERDALIANRNLQKAVAEGLAEATFGRMTKALVDSDPTDEFLAQVAKELKRARAKFPGDRIMTIALAEEFGELAKAMLDENGEAVWKEAVQTAVMAARVAIDGDSSVDEWRAAKGLDNHRLAGRSALSASQSTSREGER